jgi:molybdenum cofactor guanylyltransferase
VQGWGSRVRSTHPTAVALKCLKPDHERYIRPVKNPSSPILAMIQTGGIVLCGGQSKRMGKPKAWLPIAGDLMLPRVVRLLREAVSPLVVVAAPDQELPALPDDVAIVRDEEKGRGPLQGLAAGLAALQGRADAAYASSCDVPFLRPAFVKRMIELLGDHHISVPHIGEYLHPLAAVYRIDVVETVRTLLQENRLRPVFLFDAVPTRVVTADELADVDPTFETLRNLNTPADYEQALRDVS